MKNISISSKKILSTIFFLGLLLFSSFFLMSALAKGKPPDTKPPRKVTGLSVTVIPEGNALELNWDRIREKDLDHYNVYRSTTSGFDPSPENLVDVSPTHQYTDTGLTDGVTYYYKISAVDTSNNIGEPSDEVSGTPADSVAPEQVISVVVAVVAGGNQLELTWTASTANDFVSYKVYRSTTSGFTPGPGNLIASPITNYYLDSGLTNGVTYYYRITAVDEVPNESPPSIEANGTPVGVDNTDPYLAEIISPSTGAILSGIISILANAADAESGVDYVEFWDGVPTVGSLIGTDSASPYSQIWDTTVTSDGSHDLHVRVYDRAGNYLDSSPAVTVTVDNTDPGTATVTAPTAGENVSGIISITASAADAESGVQRVEFWLDGAGTGTLLGTDTTAPYSLSWDTMSTADGAHNLNVRVYDFAGNYLDSAATTVTVDNTVPSSASITSPSPGANLSGIILVTATGTDAGSGIDYLEFWDGVPTVGTLIGIDYWAAYSVSWDTTMASDGFHDLYVRAYDHAGNYLDSVAVIVIVDNNNPT